jgi:hypothetical protein
LWVTPEFEERHAMADLCSAEAITAAHSISKSDQEMEQANKLALSASPFVVMKVLIVARYRHPWPPVGGRNHVVHPDADLKARPSIGRCPEPTAHFHQHQRALFRPLDAAGAESRLARRFCAQMIFKERRAYGRARKGSRALAIRAAASGSSTMNLLRHLGSG